MKYYYRKRHPLKALIWIMVIFMGGWTTAFYYYGINEIVFVEEEAPVAEDEEIDLELFWDVLEVLDESYVDVTLLNDEEMIYGAVEGLVEAIGDSYTVFMTPEETSEFQESLEGELEGIGAELTVEDGELVVISPIKNSPAEAAGLLPGDIIYSVDGERTNEMTVWEAIMAIRGEKGTIVELGIDREGEDDLLMMEIVRDRVEIDSINWEIVSDDEDIAYINIYQFADDTTDEFQEAVNDILLHDISGIILDVRNNGGGYLETAVDVLSEFIDGIENAVIVKMREEEDNEIHYTSGSSRLAGIPVVVLVNSGSASASEIVAGTIQDYELGIVMGEQTFGKGSVQSIESFNDGSSLRLTVAKWYTPENRSIDDTGILPDIIVEVDYETEEDEQFEEAVLYLGSL